MRVFFLIMLFTAISILSALLTMPIPVVNPDTKVMFAGENAIVYKGGVIYLTYLQKGETLNQIMLSKSYDKGRTFVQTVIDTVSNVEYNIPPVLNVNNSQVCFVYYTQKVNQNNINELICAKLAGNVVTYSIINTNAVETPLLLNNGNFTDVFFRQNAKKQICDFLYYSNSEKSNIAESGESARVFFWGPDIFDGRVHTNDDMYFSHSGGGTNDGWPTFAGKVTMSGNLFDTSGNMMFPEPPFDPVTVFLQGVTQYVPNIRIEKSISPENYYYPFGDVINPDVDIIKIEIDGEVANYRLGNIVEGNIRTFTVYSSYPDALHPNSPIGDSLWTNQIQIPDTIWTDVQQFTIPHDRIVYIPAILWIRGDISGKQVWKSQKNTYLTGNITYINTPIGEDPAGNLTDYFGLLSDKNIIIKYKYRIDGEPLSYNNSTGANGHVWLYGAYAALGERNNEDYGAENAFRTEGVFTYEYQHPHGAPTDFYGISPFTGADTLFTFIDLHKYKFPPDLNSTIYWKKWPYRGDCPDTDQNYCSYPTIFNAAYPWYATTDWPWLNPVWPERRTDNPNPQTDIVFQRGTLHLWGSIAQMRRGFMTRTGRITNNNPDLGTWDIANFKFGPAHDQTGYLKDYHHDTRLSNSPFPIFPTYNTPECSLVKQHIDDNGNLLETETLASDQIYKSYFISRDETNIAKLYTKADRDSIYCEYSNDNGITYDKFAINPNIEDFTSVVKLFDFKLIGSKGYLVLLPSTILQLLGTVKIDFSNHTFTSSTSLIGNDAPIMSGAKGCLGLTHNRALLLSFYQNIRTLNDSTLTWIPQDHINTEQSIRKSTLLFDESDTLLLFINTRQSEDTESEFDILYFCRGYLDGITPVTDQPAPAVEPFYVKNYPNPFNPSTIIEFNLPAQTETKLEIFNIKGQRVTTLVNKVLDMGVHKVVWQGTNADNRSVGSGIYFYKLTVGNKVEMRKLLLVK